MTIGRKELRKHLFRLASEQSGYFSAAQARELGYSYQAQAHNAKAGNWLRVDRGIFRLTEWIPELHDELVRWSLWSHSAAVVSHETALNVHGIGELESPRVHLTVPPSFTMNNPAVSLHYAELPESDVLQRGGFKLTTLLRSIIDVVVVSADEDQLDRTIREALDAGLFTARQLRARAAEVDQVAALQIRYLLANVA